MGVLNEPSNDFKTGPCVWPSFKGMRGPRSGMIPFLPLLRLWARCLALPAITHVRAFASHAIVGDSRQYASATGISGYVPSNVASDGSITRVDYTTFDFSVIVKNDAKVCASGDKYNTGTQPLAPAGRGRSAVGPFIVGGTLSSPPYIVTGSDGVETAVDPPTGTKVGGKFRNILSYVFKGGDGGMDFLPSLGLWNKAPEDPLFAPPVMPFDWAMYETIASTIEANDGSDGATRVIIYDNSNPGQITPSGCWSSNALVSPETDRNQAYNTLMVFTGAVKVCLKGPIQASILAPFCEVKLDTYSHIVNGFIVAKDFDAQQGAYADISLPGYPGVVYSFEQIENIKRNGIDPGVGEQLTKGFPGELMCRKPTNPITYIDLVVENRSAYTPYDPASNGAVQSASGHQFAQINVACNTHVDLRVSMRVSCATAPSCAHCFKLGLGTSSTRYADEGACFLAGCSCYGTTVTSKGECLGVNRDILQATYTCDRYNERLVLPPQAQITMTVYDFDTVDGNYREILTVPKFIDYKMPLAVASGETVPANVGLDPNLMAFTGFAPAITNRIPNSPLDLTVEQASRGAQLFFEARNGFIDAKYEVRYFGGGKSRADLNTPLDP